MASYYLIILIRLYTFEYEYKIRRFVHSVNYHYQLIFKFKFNVQIVINHFIIIAHGVISIIVMILLFIGYVINVLFIRSFKSIIQSIIHGNGDMFYHIIHQQINILFNIFMNQQVFHQVIMLFVIISKILYHQKLLSVYHFMML